MPGNYGAPCETTYHAAHDSGVRRASVLWVVMHCTQSTTAEAAARWLSDPRANGSAHLVIDAQHCFRLLANNRVPWAAPGANRQGFHIEQAGFAQWKAARWLRDPRLLERSAWKAAAHCHAFGVPPVFVTAHELAQHRPGITTHAECSRAFGGDHTDPGSGWPRHEFLRLVANAYADQLAGLQP